MDIIKCSHCGMQVIPKTDATCPSCQVSLSEVAGAQVTVAADPVDQPRRYPKTNVSHLRGVGFGCLYAFATWVLVGIAASMVVPLFIGNLTHEGLGSILSCLGMAIAVPVGIYGFLRHQYFQGPD
jgi:hypothetical protein